MFDDFKGKYSRICHSSVLILSSLFHIYDIYLSLTRKIEFPKEI